MIPQGLWTVSKGSCSGGFVLTRAELSDKCCLITRIKLVVVYTCPVCSNVQLGLYFYGLGAGPSDVKPYRLDKMSVSISCLARAAREANIKASEQKRCVIRG